MTEQLWVVMNVGTQRLNQESKVYDTVKAAKTQCTKLNRQYGNTPQWVVMTLIEYLRLPVRMKKVRNMMSGVEIEIREDTPLCCDPSSETYWSM